MSTPQHQLPDWETPSSPQKPQRTLFNKSRFSTSHTVPPLEASQKETTSYNEQPPVTTRDRRFSDRIPRWSSLFGTKRKFLLSGLVALLLLILIIGLAVGLTRNKNKSPSLPLPSSKEHFTGDLTYYSPGPGYGACGYENTSNDAICALSHLLWDAVSTSTNPNHNPLCGKKIRITRFDEKKGGNNSVDVMVVDRCTGCKETDVDLSLKMFETLADEAQGRVVGTWAWLE